jgi:hypothetical protein
MSAREAESPFGGIYRVVMCENTFNDGLFKQKLKCIRQPGQESDFDGEVLTQDKGQSPAAIVEEELRDATSPQDSPADNEAKRLAAAYQTTGAA